LHGTILLPRHPLGFDFGGRHETAAGPSAFAKPGFDAAEEDSARVIVADVEAVLCFALESDWVAVAAEDERVNRDLVAVPQGFPLGFGEERTRGAAQRENGAVDPDAGPRGVQELFKLAAKGGSSGIR
jgi:hypothetical protein